MKPYPTYKSTNIPWLKEVPEHWEIKKCKFLFSLSTEQAPIGNSEELLSVYTDIGVKPRRELEERGNRASTTDSYWIVKKGDIIVNKLLAWMGAVGVSNYNGVTSPAYDVLRPIKNLVPKYYHELFRLPTVNQEFKRFSKGIMEMRLRLYFEQLGNLKFPYPSRQEQTQIAKFLDHKCQQIDTAIAKKSRLIELLQEQKQAIINQAVTKGIDPNVALQPSGIEWLGDIPEHWEVKKLKYATKIIYGQSPHESTYNNTGVGAILVNGPVEYSVEEFGFTRELKWTTDPKKFAPKDSLLFCLRGSTTGRLNICHADLSIGRGVAAILGYNNQVSNQFLTFLMQWLRTVISFTFQGSTFPSVTSSELDNYFISLPSLEEQQEIVEHIETESNRISTTIDKIQKEIALLEEYKTALISEAVTGKIDVRDWQPKSKHP